MAGFVAAGLLRGDHPQLDLETVLAAPPEQRPLLVHVRTQQEFSQGHIPGGLNVPVDEFRWRLGCFLAIARSPSIARWASAATWRPASCNRPDSRQRTSAADIRRTSCGSRRKAKHGARSEAVEIDRLAGTVSNKRA